MNNYNKISKNFPKICVLLIFLLQIASISSIHLNFLNSQDTSLNPLSTPQNADNTVPLFTDTSDSVFDNRVVFSKNVYSGPPNQSNNELIDSLSITSNTEFRTTATTMGWKGTGNAFDPIIIENYNFSQNTPSTRLLIQDTTLEFVIQNCIFENAANLTTFYNVSNGIVKGNIFQNATTIGLFLDSIGNHNRISLNIFENNNTGGINAYNDNDENYFYYNWWDTHSGGSDGGIYQLVYSVPGDGAVLDYAPRVHKQHWNVNELIMMSNGQLDMHMFNKGFLGNGTKVNPYLIRNINFSFAMETPLIDIANIDKHIIIESCFFDAAFLVTAINLNFVSNIAIVNCTIYNGTPSIYMDTIQNSNLKNCVLNGSATHGIYGDNINDSTIDTLSIFGTQEQGLYVRYSHNVSISNSEMENITYTGIFIQYSSEISLDHCTVQNCYAVNSRGIRSDNVDHLTITNSEVHNIPDYGVYLYYTTNSTIELCSISNTDTGIFTYQGRNCNFSSTTIWNQTHYGVEINPGIGNYILSHLDIYNCDVGIGFIDSTLESNLVVENNIHNNNRGIYLWGQEGRTHNVSISKNNLTSNVETGIYLKYCIDNVISQNLITNNYVGINCTDDTENNTIYKNIFLNNDGWDSGTTNSWDNGSYGNFWDTYEGIDEDEDGIGDSPHLIPGIANAQDNYPLTSLIGPPGINLISPLNSTIINSEMQLEFSFQNSNGTLIYNWDDTTNISVSIDTDIPLPLTEGSHILNIYVSNSQLSIMEKYVFTIDNTPPIIESWDAIEDGSELGAGTTLPFSIFDIHYEQFWYTWNGTHGTFPPVSSDIPWVEVPNITGEWTLKIYANDTAGNVQYESITIIVLAPADISLIYPTGGEIIGAYINVTWASPEDLTYNLQYSPDGGYSWVSLVESYSLTYYIWDTATSNLNGSAFLVRVSSITLGKPGEVRSETTFTILNIIKRQLPVGTTEISMPDVNLSISVSEETNVTIQRLTTLPTSMDPNASDYFGYGLYVDIVLDNPDALEVLVVSFSVAHLLETLAIQGLTIYNIEVYFFDESLDEWVPADRTDHNEILSLVIGTFDHTTTIGALGRSDEASGEFPFVLIFLIVLILGGVAGGALLIYDHQLKIQIGEVSALTQIEKYLKNLQRRFGKDG